jgi:hypothetical protein
VLLESIAALPQPGLDGGAAQSPAIASGLAARGDTSRRLPWTFTIATVAAQAADAHSTLAVLGSGGAEGNPLVVPFASDRTRLIAFKAGVAASTLFAANRLARHHRIAALLLVTAINSGYGAVAIHNYRLAARLRNSR